MKLACPSCNQEIPAADISLNSGWAKCTACNEVFQLAAILPGYERKETVALPVERPFDAWPVVEREPERLLVHIPPHGMRAGHWALLGFAIFWLAFITFWTAGALGIFFGKGKINWEDSWFAAFSTPFWLVGFIMLGSVVWLARGSRTLYLDASQMLTELRCGWLRRRKVLDRADVQHARKGVSPAKRENEDSTYTPLSVEVVFTRGSFRLPCASEAEQAWLLQEINDFLKTTPYRPGAGSNDWASEMTSMTAGRQLDSTR